MSQWGIVREIHSLEVICHVESSPYKKIGDMDKIDKVVVLNAPNYFSSTLIQERKLSIESEYLGEPYYIWKGKL